MEKINYEWAKLRKEVFISKMKLERAQERLEIMERNLRNIKDKNEKNECNKPKKEQNN